MIIRAIATSDGNIDLETVRILYGYFEEYLINVLSSASEKESVSIKLFDGITIDSEYIPEKNKVNNLTGKEIMVPKHIKVKSNISRTFQSKINSR